MEEEAGNKDGRKLFGPPKKRKNCDRLLSLSLSSQVYNAPSSDAGILEVLLLVVSEPGPRESSPGGRKSCVGGGGGGGT